MQQRNRRNRFMDKYRKPDSYQRKRDVDSSICVFLATLSSESDYRSKISEYDRDGYFDDKPYTLETRSLLECNLCDKGRGVNQLS